MFALLMTQEILCCHLFGFPFWHLRATDHKICQIEHDARNRSIFEKNIVDIKMEQGPTNNIRISGYLHHKNNLSSLTWHALIQLINQTNCRSPKAAFSVAHHISFTKPPIFTHAWILRKLKIWNLCTMARKTWRFPGATMLSLNYPGEIKITSWCQ